MLDYRALDLQPFEPGALIWFGGRMHKLVDPWRTKGSWREAYKSEVSTLGDKIKLWRLRSRLMNAPLEKIFARPEQATRAELNQLGFSKMFTERFFEPFFGGIMLDRDLKPSSRMFEFVFSMMSSGRVSVPAKGMGAIPAQIASKLPPNALRVNSPVEKISADKVTLAGGEEIAARAVVIATEGPAAAKLVPGLKAVASRSVSCFYYSADEAPVKEPILVLAGARGGTVNNLAVMSQAARGYAPEGKSLVSVTVLGNPALTEEQLGGFVIADLKGWFGPVVRSWKLLKSYRIDHAQPEQLPGALEPIARPVKLAPGIYVCGDHRDTASIQGAMYSGRRAAEAVMADLGK